MIAVVFIAALCLILSEKREGFIGEVLHVFRRSLCE